MKVAVKDACVLIDLANGDLLDEWFALGIETFTTILVLDQVRDAAQWPAILKQVKRGRLKISVLSSAEMTQMLAEVGHLRIGIADQSVLFLAVHREAILLTGDRRLRLEGTRRGVDIRGLLWILDELVRREVLRPRKASQRLTTILEQGAFLPADECEARHRQWRAEKK